MKNILLLGALLMFAFTTSAQTEAPACSGKEKTEKAACTKSADGEKKACCAKTADGEKKACCSKSTDKSSCSKTAEGDKKACCSKSDDKKACSSKSGDAAPTKGDRTKGDKKTKTKTVVITK
jgi:hypothetical protein